MSGEPANVDPAFYRMIGELTGEVRGLKESLEFRTRQIESQFGEMRADIRATKHEANNQHMKVSALEALFTHEAADIRDRFGDVERRIDTLDAKVASSERPIEELMTMRVRALAWLGGISAGGGVVWLFLGHRVVAALQSMFQSGPENLR